MTNAAPRRPFLSLPFLLPSWSESGSLVFRRTQSSYRRTKQRLRVKPDASFAPSTTETQEHIIFNPPSSTPSVYHTPTKFLPRNDLRRHLHAVAAPIDPGTLDLSQQLPPPVRKPYEKQYHLTEAQLEEMRRLRQEDPISWSRTKLAKKFNCSNLFVGIVCQVDKKKREQQKQVLEAVKSRWGTIRRNAREDRTLRRETWGRDE